MAGSAVEVAGSAVKVADSAVKVADSAVKVAGSAVEVAGSAVKVADSAVQLAGQAAGWAKLGAEWAKLSAEWAKLGAEWAKLGAEPAKLGAEWAKLGAEWAKFGAEWAKLGASWGRALAPARAASVGRGCFSFHRRALLFPRGPPFWAPMSSPDTREVILEARELTREFDGVRALDKFSFQLHRGEVLGLLGANGAGKTTAMNCMLGLTLPTSGDLFAFGKSLEANRIEILKKTNFSSAYVSLPGNLKVWQNLTVFAQIYGVPNGKRKIAELMELLEVSHLKDRVTGQLSAGESTRVNLCKAFLNDPELLMLDEPTASLDPDIADKVRKVVRRVQSERNIGILYTSHNMRDIEEVCDRVIFLHNGKIVAEGTPDQIVAKFSENSLEDVFIKIARSGDLEA